MLTCLLKASLRDNWLHATPDELLKVLEVGIKTEVLDVANNGALMLNVENKTSVRVVEFDNNATNWDISIKKETNVPVHPDFVFLYTHSGKIVQGSMDGSLVVLVYEQCNDLYDVSIFLGSIGATNSRLSASLPVQAEGTLQYTEHQILHRGLGQKHQTTHCQERDDLQTNFQN